MIDPRRASGWLGKNFGEDWVVPKTEMRYLVTRSLDASLLLTAYGADGQLIGERVFPDGALGSDIMKRLTDENLVEAWQEIPDGPVSATRFLEGGTRRP